MMAGRDTKTRYQGVYARHSISCPKSGDKKARCRCKPAYFGVAFDKSKGTNGGTRKTRHRDTAIAAKNERDDLLKLIATGQSSRTGLRTLQDVIDLFTQAAQDGVAMNKQGKPYRPKAVTGLRTDLKRLPEHLRVKRFDRVTSADYQHVVDDLVREGLSGSRIQSVINSTRSLYRWAKARGYIPENVALNVDLPALNAGTRDRVARPAEMVVLLDALRDENRPPFALAVFAGLRAEEIRAIDWAEIDLSANVLMVGDAKTPAGVRVVPICQYLKAYLRAEWMRQGRPKSGKVCLPRRLSRSGKLSTDQLLKQMKLVWEKAGLKPIGFHECRHTCSTWLDSAGVRPKVVSVWMGHATPERQHGAAAITQNTYTHLLDGDLEDASGRLDKWLKSRLSESRKVAVQ